MLTQEERPLLTLVIALAPKHLGLSVYNKELLVVLGAIEKWRHYLEANPFIIKIDHESL